MRRCAYCEKEATTTVITGRDQVDVCEDHLAKRLDDYFVPPKVIDLVTKREIEIGVKWAVGPA